MLLYLYNMYIILYCCTCVQLNTSVGVYFPKTEDLFFSYPTLYEHGKISSSTSFEDLTQTALSPPIKCTRCNKHA